MKTLFVVVLAEKINIRIDIEEEKTIEDLQTAIQRSFPECRAEKLMLYLGKKDDQWLQRWDPDIERLTKGELPDEMMELVDESNIIDPQRLVSEFNFRDKDDFRRDEFHILVELPHQLNYFTLVNRRRRQIAKQRRKGVLTYRFAWVFCSSALTNNVVTLAQQNNDNLDHDCRFSRFGNGSGQSSQPKKFLDVQRRLRGSEELSIVKVTRWYMYLSGSVSRTRYVDRVGL